MMNIGLNAPVRITTQWLAERIEPSLIGIRNPGKEGTQQLGAIKPRMSAYGT
jgi:hypothetical protein